MTELEEHDFEAAGAGVTGARFLGLWQAGLPAIL